MQNGKFDIYIHMRVCVCLCFFVLIVGEHHRSCAATKT